MAAKQLAYQVVLGDGELGLLRVGPGGVARHVRIVVVIIVVIVVIVLGSKKNLILSKNN